MDFIAFIRVVKCFIQPRTRWRSARLYTYMSYSAQ